MEKIQKIQMDTAVVHRIHEVISGPAKLVLDYDDGVGSFSRVGSCSIGTDFNLLAVPPALDLTDHRARLASPLGSVYYKKYSARYLDTGLKLTLGSFNQLELSGTGGLIDGNVSLIDERHLAQK